MSLSQRSINSKTTVNMFCNQHKQPIWLCWHDQHASFCELMKTASYQKYIVFISWNDLAKRMHSIHVKK